MAVTLLNNKELAWSPIVANNAMNRERIAVGVNSYQKEMGINPIDFLLHRRHQNNLRWTDLCCGKGNALIQAANQLKEESFTSNLSLVGIDLVDYFSSHYSLPFLNLQVLNLDIWQPENSSDLITIIHGLHYIGDKIGLIVKSAAALKSNGLFWGNLDLNNIRIEGEKDSKKVLKKYFKDNEIHYNSRTKVLKIEGFQNLQSNFQYLGADTTTGANYTGQEAITSVYRNQNA